MAVRIVCECGAKQVEKLEDGFLVVLGMAELRHYCDTCRIPAEAFLRARDELHTDIQRQWTGGLAALREKYGADMNGGSLPE